MQDDIGLFSKDPLNRRQRHAVSADFLHQRRNARAQVFAQGVQFLTSEEFGRMAAHAFREVRADD